MPDLERMNSKEQDTRPVPAPRLRFPGFVGEWEQKELGEVAGLVSRKVKTSEILATDYISTENILPDFLGVERTNKKPESGNITKFSCGDVLVSNIRPYLRKVWAAEWEGGASNDVLVFRASGQLNPEYFVYLLRNDKFIAYMMQGAKGLKMPRGDIQKIKEYPIPLPSLPEQTRIAAALSSLDAIIAAHQSKQDALREHKRGLMAGLFPAEGERVPRLRFPEFEGAGEWEEKKFNQVIEKIIDFRGRTPKKLGMEWGGGNILSLSANNIKDGYIDLTAENNKGSEELYRAWMGKADLAKGDILLTTEAPMGKSVLVPDDKKYILSQRVIAIKTRDYVDNEFLVQLIWSNFFQLQMSKLATGSTAKGINQKALEKIFLFLPSLPEQTRIAACLSSLDSLIAAQGDHIAALQAFKRGLMQGLFPAAAADPSTTPETSE